LRLEGSDKLDRPPSKFDKKRKKVKGNAVQIWVLIRYLPVLIGDKVTDKNDPLWVMILTLAEMVQLLTSPVMARNSLSYINDVVTKYLHLRVSLFPRVPLRPKHHFLEHYPFLAQVHICSFLFFIYLLVVINIISCMFALQVYGPAMRSSTLRFESKHKYYRAEFLSKKCYKNPTYSLAMSHQRLQSSLTANPIFENSPVVEDPVHFSTIKSSVDVMNCLKSSFGMEVASNLFYSSKMSHHYTSYFKDAVIVTKTISKSKLLCMHIQLLLTDGKTAYALGV